MISRFEISHTKPGFKVASVPVVNREVEVTEIVELDLRFGKLLHFIKVMDAPQTRALIVALLSGHFATLLQGTVNVLLRDYDGYITDWTNPLDVPLEASSFGVEDCVEFIIRFLEGLGPGRNILAVCQPCVKALIAVAVAVAVAVMSEELPPATPRSVTWWQARLMFGKA